MNNDGERVMIPCTINKKLPTVTSSLMRSGTFEKSDETLNKAAKPPIISEKIFNSKIYISFLTLEW